MKIQKYGEPVQKGFKIEFEIKRVRLNLHGTAADVRKKCVTKFERRKLGVNDENFLLFFASHQEVQLFKRINKIFSLVVFGIFT